MKKILISVFAVFVLTYSAFAEETSIMPIKLVTKTEIYKGGTPKNEQKIKDLFMSGVLNAACGGLWDYTFSCIGGDNCYYALISFINDINAADCTEVTYIAFAHEIWFY